MPQNKILLDSNSYFRLAKSIHPLLFEIFGEHDNCLYVLKELENEWARSSRLQSKFSWVSDKEYKSNRGKQLALSRAERKQLPIVTEFIWQAVQGGNLGPSRIDAIHIAYSYILTIPLVSDDQDMISVCNLYGVETMSTLRLLQLMLHENHVDMVKVRQIAAYWTYEGDLPAKYHSEFEQFFNEKPPLA